MIKSFAHKGLERFHQKGDKRGIKPDHATKLRLLLGVLDNATSLQDLSDPRYRLHPLKGDKQGQHAITVNGNWRLFFQFTDGDVYVLDYDDYH